MIAGKRTGLMREQPPMTITTGALREAGVEHPSALAAVVAPAGHIAFGTAGGVLYGLVRNLAPHVSGRLLGVAFGLAVWVVSYKGWIPALRILPSPEADRPGRPTVMVIAHLVYGVVLGWLHD